MYLIGYDLGSSSIKAALIDAVTQEVVHICQYPETEMSILSKQAGWAEQEPELWWTYLCKVSRMLLTQSNVDPSKILSIGISYQMHGLVLVDREHKVLRPSIIWCDSRAIEIGVNAFRRIGEAHCLSNYLNSPGNFTASKLKWVKENEAQIYKRIHKMMLPGDYIAMKMTGQINTTISGLSEAILWNFKTHTIAKELLDFYGIEENLVPNLVETFSEQGRLQAKAAEELGLSEGTPLSYRAGDQANNALSLGVFEANEVAATGGTSGVVYGILDQVKFDPKSRVNGFAHVNHTQQNPRIGQLLCINGAGSQYAWIKNQLAQDGMSYTDLEEIQKNIPIGADGLRIIPFGNGSERMLENTNIGAQINNLQFNRHTRVHIFRAALEGIAFSFVYGFQLLKEIGIEASVVKVGNDNLFQSEIFSTSIANLLNIPIEVIKTSGAIGAAKAAGFGLGYYTSLESAIGNNSTQNTIYPSSTPTQHEEAYRAWKNDLEHRYKQRS